MSDNKEGPVCSFCGAKKGQYSEIYKSNIGDQYICKECTDRTPCNNRIGHIKCDKCKNCKE